MSPRRVTSWRISTAGLAGFLAGAALTGVVMWNVVAVIPSRQSGPVNAGGDDCGQATLDTAGRTVEPGEPEPPAVVAASRDSSGPPRISANPIADLRGRGLELPVERYDRTRLQGTFSDTRGGGRRHEAIDILAPRNTPVLAVENGTIARLFESQAGGTTIYQFDPTSSYVYYYAHLERYADGITEGDKVRRGQVIGYVGTSGNAPANTPHLHFAIFKLTGKRQWWDGTPIDPYEVLR